LMLLFFDFIKLPIMVFPVKTRSHEDNQKPQSYREGKFDKNICINGIKNFLCSISIPNRISSKKVYNK
ncbi:hypothetical protein DV951_00440, partial [Staphylococcus pseudintermedius]